MGQLICTYHCSLHHCEYQICELAVYICRFLWLSRNLQLKLTICLSESSKRSLIQLSMTLIVLILGPSWKCAEWFHIVNFQVTLTLLIFLVFLLGLHFMMDGPEIAGSTLFQLRCCRSMRLYVSSASLHWSRYTFPYTPVLEQLSLLCKCQCHGLVLLNFPVDLVRNLFPPFVATHNNLIDFQAMTGATRQKVQLDLLGAQLRLQCQCCHPDGSLSNSMHDTSLAYVHSLEY